MNSWLGRIVAAVAVWGIVLGGAYALGNSPRPGLLAVVVGAATAVVWLVLDVAGEVEPVRWRSGAELPPPRPPGEDQRWVLLQRVISQHLDGREVGEGLFRQLVELTDQRLVMRHGVSVRADPARAADLVGPELAAVAAARPPYPRLTLAQIERIVSRIEALSGLPEMLSTRSGEYGL